MKVEKTQIHFMNRSFSCLRRPRSEMSQSNLGCDVRILVQGHGVVIVKLSFP